MFTVVSHNEKGNRIPGSWTVTVLGEVNITKWTAILPFLLLNPAHHMGRDDDSVFSLLYL